MVILGASGAGKSSFLKAGLLARLSRDEEHFLVLPTVRPDNAALTGFRGLHQALGLSGRPTLCVIEQQLANLRGPVMERFQRHAVANGESHRTKAPTLILPIDQGEELFTGQNLERADALVLLRSLFAMDDNLLGIITIRSDSFSQLQNDSLFGDLPRLPFDLSRLSLGAFKEVIQGPCRLAKPALTIEPALIDRLLTDLDNADALPLLAFTLKWLYSHCGQDRKVKLNDYEQDLGGLRGAIDRAVEAAFTAGLADPALPSTRPAFDALAQRACIPWLVQLDETENVPRRRVAAASELPAASLALVRHLIDQRLLVSDVGNGEETVEFSHEAVLRHWGGLSDWIEQESVALRTLSGVRAAAREWNWSTLSRDSNRSSWLAHRGSRLTDAERLMGRADYAQSLGEEGRAYLIACRDHEVGENADRGREVVDRLVAVCDKHIAMKDYRLAAFAGVAALELAQRLKVPSVAEDAEAALRRVTSNGLQPTFELAGWELLIVDRGVVWLFKDGHVAARDIVTGTLRNDVQLYSYALTSFVVSPDRTKIAIADVDGNFYLYDVATQTRIHYDLDLMDRVTGIAFSANGKHLTATLKPELGEAESGTWDVATGKRLSSNELPKPSKSQTELTGERVQKLINLGRLFDHPWAVLPKKGWVAARGSLSSGGWEKVKVVALRSGKLLFEFSAKSRIQKFVWDQSGRWLAAANIAGEVMLWHVGSSEMTVVGTLDGIDQLLSSATGDWVTAWSGQTVMFIGTGSYQSGTRTVPGKISAVIEGPNGQYAVIFGDAGLEVLLPGAARLMALVRRVHSDPCGKLLGVIWHDDGKHVILRFSAGTAAYELLDKEASFEEHIEYTRRRWPGGPSAKERFDLRLP